MNRWICVTLGLALVCMAATASADNQVTAEWNVDVPGSTFGSFGGTGLSQARGQTFEATVDGRVVTIALRVARNSDHTEPIVIALFDLDGGGEPAGTALMSGEFPADSVPVNVILAPTVFAFEDGAMVTAGQRYAITFGPVNLDPISNNYHTNGASSENATYEQGASLRSADAGATWTVSTVTDWGFRVVVDDATPVEAASWSVIKGLFR